MPKIILASASPRRREMLTLFSFPLEIDAPAVDETPVPGLAPSALAEMLAERKGASVVGRRGDNDPVIAADTVVVSRGEVLGKPRDTEDAERMLRLLSGTDHEVVTGVALWWRGKKQVFSVTSTVTFKSLKEKEISDYIATGEPMDKAGAYAIQGVGGFMVRTITGSASNVVGLPVAEVIAALQEMGFLRGLTIHT
ncbi:MAG TPA: Maf family protein [bacterium]|nr:Maf family protein [bacterium]